MDNKIQFQQSVAGALLIFPIKTPWLPFAYYMSSRATLPEATTPQLRYQQPNPGTKPLKGKEIPMMGAKLCRYQSHIKHMYQRARTKGIYSTKQQKAWCPKRHNGGELLAIAFWDSICRFVSIADFRAIRQNNPTHLHTTMTYVVWRARPSALAVRPFESRIWNVDANIPRPQIIGHLRLEKRKARVCHIKYVMKAGKGSIFPAATQKP